MSKSERRIAFGAGVSHATALAAEAEAARLRQQLAALQAAPPAPAPAAPPPPPPPLPPPTHREVWRDLQQRSPMLAANYLLAHSGELDAPSAAVRVAPDAPSAAPPVSQMTYRQAHRELQARDPMAAAAIMIAHGHELDQAVAP